ncbi:MAG: hypothetical protein ACR2N6_07745, partial [Miltoncostaeaceae bacterium]
MASPEDHLLTGSEPPDVLTAHITAPPVRPGSVIRGALVDRLLRAQPVLSVVSGPAGSGKTTVMAQCCEADRCPAWLSLSDSENDPVGFWLSVIESIRKTIDDFGPGYRARLRAGGASAVSPIVASIANELVERDMPLRLYLDDLHRLTSVECRRSLHEFIDLLPPTVHVVVGSRASPPIPLAKRRADGALLEIDAEDLAMSPDEARRQLAALGVSLDPGPLETLVARTEGWTAGLQLAGMALRGAPEPAAAVDALDGTELTIAEYFASEVVAQAPPNEQEFMLKTSLLRRMSGALCDAVTGGSGGSQTLRALSERNAFLVPLDTVGEWFRYHHLFADLLRAQLGDGADADLEVLNGRAFDWLREAGHFDDAIRHGLAAGRRDEVAELFCAGWWELFADGRLATARSILDSFTAAEIANHAPLALAAAMVTGLSNDREGARRLLAQAELAEHAFDGRPPDGTRSIVSSRCLAASFLALDGIEQALADGSAVLALEPEDSPWRPLAALTVGLARVMRGDVRESRAYLEEASSVPDQAIRAYALVELANVQLRLGEPARATVTGEEARRLTRDAGWSDTFLGTTADAVAGLCRAAIGDSEGARALL